ncbi:hypothetical protein [Aminicella lysinilytica]|uniref:hypothetical protein n=1 Tax=Aminicella lysinilytica TaxID=433323 RepID=UPI0026EFEB4B|nr:hypothetical protein [Aminicella lysinilytica]
MINNIRMKKVLTGLLVAMVAFCMMPTMSYAAGWGATETGDSTKVGYKFLGGNFNSSMCEGNRFALQDYTIGHITSLGGSLKDVRHVNKVTVYDDKTGFSLNTSGAYDGQGMKFIPAGDNVYYIQLADGGYLKRTGKPGTLGVTTTTSESEATQWQFTYVSGEYHYWLIRENTAEFNAYLGTAEDGQGGYYMDCWKDKRNCCKMYINIRSVDMSSDGVLNMYYNGGTTPWYHHYTAEEIEAREDTYSCSYDPDKLNFSPRPVSKFVKVVGYNDANGGVTKTVEHFGNGEMQVVYRYTLEDIYTGKKANKRFSVCLTEHIWDDGVITRQPTCTDEGIKVYTCEKYSEDLKSQTKLSDKNCLGQKVESIPALGHSWGKTTYEWSSDNSKCTATRKCTRDPDHVETETVNTTRAVTTEPTFESAGIITYTATFKNSAFGTQTKDVTTEKIGHDWGDATYEWSADYTTCTAKCVCKNDPTHVHTKIVNTTKTVVVPPSAGVSGSGRATAEFDDPLFENQSTDYLIAAEPITPVDPTEPGTGGATDPTNPTDPSTPTEPGTGGTTDPTNPTDPSTPTEPGTGTGSDTGTPDNNQSEGTGTNADNNSGNTAGNKDSGSDKATAAASNSESKGVDTGDMSGITVWLVTLMIGTLGALGTFVWAIRYRKKSK